jgi:hypothetical protein
LPSIEETLPFPMSSGVKEGVQSILFSKEWTNVEVLDYLMGYESYLRKRRISVSSTNQPENIVIRHVGFLSLSLVYLHLK